MLASQEGEEPERGAERGIYRSIEGSKWELVAKFNGVNISSDYRENQPGINPDGQLVLMSNPIVVQIYIRRSGPSPPAVTKRKINLRLPRGWLVTADGIK